MKCDTSGKVICKKSAIFTMTIFAFANFNSVALKFMFEYSRN